MSEIVNTGIQCLRDEAQAILDLIPRMGKDFEQAVQLIRDCKGKVIVTGVGKSGHVGSKIAATLASTGTPSFYLNPLDAYHGDLGMIATGDVVMAISYSGNTDELLRFIPLILERNIPIIGISGNPDSLLGKYSTCHLDAAVSKEADPLNLAPTSSTTAALAIGDALACALVKVNNFKDDDFARFHPGGSLGKRLLGKVSDLSAAETHKCAGYVVPEDAIAIAGRGIEEAVEGTYKAFTTQTDPESGLPITSFMHGSPAENSGFINAATQLGCRLTKESHTIDDEPVSNGAPGYMQLVVA